MINNNKILTVSYGTFSCTLEGFDDSFGTMKAIAEYFRDLASDDRYFGAEPPQPDAEMLTRIAQKEVSRRVQAREHQGKIVLSAIEEEAAPAPTFTPPPAVPSEEAKAEPQQGAQTSPAEQTDQIEVKADEALDAALAAEDTAQYLAEPPKAEAAPVADQDHFDEETPTERPDLEAEASELLTDTPPLQAPSTEETAEEASPIVESQSVDAFEEDEVDDEDVAEIIAKISEEIAESDENDIVPGQPDAEVEAFFATSDGLEHIESPSEDTLDDEEDALAATSTSDSIAAKLQRIRAVVMQSEYADEDGFSEDEHAHIESDNEAQDVVAQARREIEDALEADEAADAEALSSLNAAPETENDEIASILARLDREEAYDAVEAQESENQLAEDSVEADIQNDELVDNLFEEETSAEPEDSIEDIQADPAPEVPAAAVKKPKLKPSTNLSLEPAESEGTQNAPRARVIKVKRADLAAAIKRGDLEEYDDEDASPADEPLISLDDLAPAKKGETSLSAEEENDLARELAALELDIENDLSMTEELVEQTEEVDLPEATQVSEEITETTAIADLEIDAETEPLDTDEAPVAAAAVRPTRKRLPKLDSDEDEGMMRLLAEADHQMEEPESATRRDAFAHLRAAVAAKKADEALGTADDGEKCDNAYRSDLADAVRPRRAVTAGTRTERPGEGRPAPLKLVAEQRVDVTRPKGPVRPRRVASIKDQVEPEAEGDSFAEFAANMGATKLPQLLEAAAAYLSFVEDRDQFSRPQLMNKVRQIDPEGFSREDGLRSFGQLLRSGKIEKLKPGRFIATEDIGYRPDQRAAG